MRSLSGRAARGRKRPILVLFALVAACSGGDEAAGPAPSVPAECTTVRSPGILGATHIQDGERATYNSTPPTSGEHYARPVLAGVYAEPVQNERQVHNLEHGHVLIQYRDLEDDQVARLEAVVRADPKMVLLAPYPDMDPRIAFTSWGKIQTCDAWWPDAPALARFFVRSHRDNAPESIA